MTEPQPITKQALPVAVIVLAMMSVAALCIFVVSGSLADAEKASKVNRDGISCIIEELNAHRLNSYNADAEDAKRHNDELMAPAPPAQPVPQELLAACQRFLEAP